MNELEPPRSQHVGQFDGLRGLLALWVVISHILCWCGWADATFPWPLSRLWSAFIFAQPAVETFMILSGFAISFLLHQNQPPYYIFIVGRFFRIYPVYALCLTLGIATTYLTPVVLDTSLWRDTIYYNWIGSYSVQERANITTHSLSHATLLFGLLPKSILPYSTGTLLPPSWSITLEWQYYLVAPAIAWLVRSGTGMLCVVFAVLVGLHYSHVWQNPENAFLPAQLPLFLMGIGSYHLYAHHARSPNGFPVSSFQMEAWIPCGSRRVSGDGSMMSTFTPCRKS